MLKNDASARDRLLAAANELFYEEGVHTVGIDRVIERAGVAKASLYSTFGSKEELVRAYLEMRASIRAERISKFIAPLETPRAKILGVFDALAEIANEPTFRGCAFVNASAEGPRSETRIRQACTTSRGWTRGLFKELAKAFGAKDSEVLGRRLALLYDGAVIGAGMESDPGVVREARAMAEIFLDLHASPPATKKKGVKRSGERSAVAR
jgi:AcrR family transcriptional regulator